MVCRRLLIDPINRVMMGGYRTRPEGGIRGSAVIGAVQKKGQTTSLPFLPEDTSPNTPTLRIPNVSALQMMKFSKGFAVLAGFLAYGNHPISSRFLSLWW